MSQMHYIYLSFIHGNAKIGHMYLVVVYAYTIYHHQYYRNV